MHVRPELLIGREAEWASLTGFLSGSGRLAIVYGPRRAGTSFLLDGLARATGGVVHQAIVATARAQLADAGRSVGRWLSAGALDVRDWADLLERLIPLDAPFVAIDELPYLLETTPELPSLLQRYVDRGQGPRLILCGSAMSVMSDLSTARAPLFGRASLVVVPGRLSGPTLAELWDGARPEVALWIDAALGGLAGYRPLVAPPGRSLERWMTDVLLSPSSPLLDLADATLADLPGGASRSTLRSILAAIAAGEHTFSAIGRVAGVAATALPRPLGLLERAGLVTRIPDPLRSRRDRYDLGDPYLSFWLSVVEPNRSALAAGRSRELWPLLEPTWRSTVLGPRWESIVRTHISERSTAVLGEPAQVVGATTVADRSQRASMEVDLLAISGPNIVAIGETKLKRLGRSDLARLEKVRTILDAPQAQLVLASATSVDLPPRDDVIPITPAEVYSSTDRPLPKAR